MLLHPEVAIRDCADCLLHLYDEKTGEVVIGRNKKPRKRDKSCLAPCVKDPEKGCPKGTAKNQKSLTAQNQEAYEHYKRCRAVNRFPDDPIVERNAVIIDSIERAVERKRDVELRELLLLAATGGLNSGELNGKRS